jgi:asparagine synthetase B (glutamine-hydrolysing)
MLAVLAETVDRDTPSGVNARVSLSGGIDSSSLVGLLAREHAAPNRCIEAFSIRPAHTPDESPLIDTTVRHTRVPHRYVPLDSLDHRQALERLLGAHDEPVRRKQAAVSSWSATARTRSSPATSFSPRRF